MFLIKKDEPFKADNYTVQKAKHVGPDKADLYLAFVDEEDKELWIHFSHEVNSVLKSEISDEFKKNILKALIEKNKELIEYVTPINKNGVENDENLIYIITKFNVLESENPDEYHW